MVDLYELKQLAAFADLGTLSRVAEEFHVSTPSVTRSMQHLEQYFGVPLFTRGKNRISLNEAGQLAVTHARKLLEAADQAVAQVRAFDQRQRTIVVKSCAPAPLWVLLRKLNDAQPEKMVSSAICQNAEVLAAWQDGQCDIAVLPFPIDGARFFMEEALFVSVPPGHELARHSSLRTSTASIFFCGQNWASGTPSAGRKCPLPSFWSRRIPPYLTSWCGPPPCPASPQTMAAFRAAIPAGSISR